MPTRLSPDYDIDNLGRLKVRTDNVANTFESFDYDALNRLTLVNGGNTPSMTIGYKSNGNIDSKTGVGAFVYGDASHPHAATKAGSNSYTYDKKGNMLTGSGSSYVWSEANQLTRINKGGLQIDFIYDADGNRVRKSTNNGQDIWYVQTRLDLGDAFEEQLQGGVTTYRHTLSAAGSPYAMVETNPSGTVLKTQYLHADHQGSIKAVSDTSGAVIERMAYDAWGKRSDALSHSTTRGYTAHEMLDNVGLIHMNGRVYDPLLARFLSVDPINQAPDNAQSYNPYSYVFNSPMMFTDPSGFSTWAKYRRPVVGVAASVLTYGAATTYLGLGEFTASVLAGGVGGGVQSGTMQGALRGAVMAAAFYGVGEASGAHAAARAGVSMEFGERVTQVIGHAAVACAGAVSSGGQCGPAAAAQAFTSGIGTELPDGYIEGTMARATVGGIAARMAGGEFREGAFTAAYAYLFNEKAADLRAKYDLKNLRGHHWVPFDAVTDLDLSIDALAEIGQAKSGPLTERHGWSKSHAEYNDAVRSELKEYMEKNGIEAAKMTRLEMKNFISMIKNSSHPLIQPFVRTITSQMVGKALSSGGFVTMDLLFGISKVGSAASMFLTPTTLGCAALNVASRTIISASVAGN